MFAPCCPFLCGLKRKLQSNSYLALITLFVLCFLVNSHEAGVIKKRDTNATAIPNDIIKPFQETAAPATVLRPQSNSSLDTELKTIVTDTSLLMPAATSSKELMHNEIVLNESKKAATNQTFKKPKTELEAAQMQQINLQDLQQLSKAIETKEQTTRDSQEEFNQNDIKAEQTLKFENSPQNENRLEIHKDFSVLSSADLRTVDNKESKHLKSRAKVEQENLLRESKTEPELAATEATATSLSHDNKPLDNSIENSQEKPHLEMVNRAALDLTSSKPLSGHEEQLLAAKTADTDKTTSRENLSYRDTLEISTAEPNIRQNLVTVNNSSIVPLKAAKTLDNLTSPQNQTKPKEEVLAKASFVAEETLASPQNQTKPKKEILAKASLGAEETLASSQNQTKPKEEIFAKASLGAEETLAAGTVTKDNLEVFEGEKKQFARSMFKEEITTLNPLNQDEIPYKPSTPIKLSIKEGIPEGKKEAFVEVLNNSLNRPLNIKEKKPKFINDNSTNAQQLNLPNNAEVWSLAAMKSLPKSNITMETAPAQNETLRKVVKAADEENSSTILKNNSEKSLLDWSQIMRDKELASSTTPKEEPAVSVGNVRPETAATLAAVKTPIQEFVNLNSLTESEAFSTSTISPVLTNTFTTMSINNKENTEQNLSLAAASAASTPVNSSSSSSNPFNTSLNIEPNLNEINLTSNPNKSVLSNGLHTTTETTTTTAGNDVKMYAHNQTETSNAAATPATVMTAALSTTATAVRDETTTVEQISSETTTVSSLETGKQNVSLNSGVVVNEQQQQLQNKNYNVNKEESLSHAAAASHNNELDNKLLNKNQFNQNENSDSITKTTTTTTPTTTVVPITTFRPTFLAITTTTSTTSKAETFEQEIDQKSNEIQANLTNTQQQQRQSIFNTTKAISNETLTTTTSSSKANSRTSLPWENEPTATTTSSSRDVLINEATTEFNLSAGTDTPTTTTTTTATATQTSTPKQVLEQKYEENASTSSAGLIEEQTKLKNTEEYQNTTTEQNFFVAGTSTETPVANEKDQQIFENFAPTTETETAAVITTTSTTVLSGQNTIATTVETPSEQKATQENTLGKQVEEDVQIATTTAAATTTIPTATTASTKIMSNTTQETNTTSSIEATTFKEEETYITLLDDTTTTTEAAAAAQTHSTTIPTITATHTAATTASDKIASATTTTTTTPSLSSSSTALPSPITTKIADIYNVINSTTTEVIQTTTQRLLTEIVDPATPATTTTTSTPFTTNIIAYITEMLPPATTTPTSQTLPTDGGPERSLPTLTSIMGGNSGNMYTKNSQASGEVDVNVIIAITVSVIGVIALILLVGFLYLMRKRQKQTSYSQRCRPVSLDEYTIDNASVGDSMRKSNALRASKRTYGNLAFDDPALRHNPMGVQELAKFVQEKLRIFEEFRDVPQITSRLDEVPTGCEDKNRYANVLPLPETRVILQRLNDDEKSEYINANYVTGTKDPPNYYIACQAPLESTVEDFWRMIWEQQSRVIIQATDLIENGVEKCAEYLPPSVTLDNHSIFGDFQITLQNREVKDKYAISTLLLKHVGENATRELTHYWYKWPEKGVPTEEAPIIAMLLEARSSLISYAIEQANEDKEKSSVATLKSAEEGTVATNSSTAAPPTNSSKTSSANSSSTEINGNISMVHIKKAARNQGPLTVHCSPGTGRTGTIIACDIAIRSLESPKRIVDIPQIVYYVRRGRASAVLTKEQYEFIYKVANMYAAKITNPTNYN